MYQKSIVVWLSTIFLVCWVFLVSKVEAQTPKLVRGIVLEESSDGKFSPLVGATIYWADGGRLSTYADSLGAFIIPWPEGLAEGQKPSLVVRSVGYEPDTIQDFSSDKLRIVLASYKTKTLKEVSVEGRIPPSFQLLDPINTQMMTSKELLKAACCNLAESFETNPTIEVNYADAVSGARQIQMLGLSGNYVLMTQENLPGIRGIFANYSLGFTPGTWIESIQVTKGVGSVANGYESMSGQINVEIKKPEWNPKTREKLFVNAYGNSMGRFELNANSTQKISANWHTNTLVHGNLMDTRWDMNHDGFLDLPTGRQANFMHRWAYNSPSGLSFQAGFQVLADRREGGTMDHVSHGNTGLSHPYTISLENNLVQAFTKVGYIFPSKKYKSVGLMQSFTAGNTRQVFGPSNRYSAVQNTYYANLIYQSIVGSTNLKFRLGSSLRLDQYDEEARHLSLESLGGKLTSHARLEVVPGVFSEFTWNPRPTITAVAGLRGDYHNIFGYWFTPRLHLKFDLLEETTLRLSAGTGRRLANFWAENSSLMASSRSFVAPSTYYKRGDQTINPEYSVNGGASFQHSFNGLGRKTTFTLDAYHTRFLHQLIVDMDESPGLIKFSNLDGASYSNAVQAMVESQISRRFDLRLAYKWLDVWQTYHGRLLQRPFVSTHRFFINLAYATRSKWHMDATLNWNGSKRIPFTGSNPDGLRFPDRSPSFFMLNAQISKTLNRRWDLYVGGENLLGFRQKQLIIDPQNPFGDRFDASLTWGAVFGRMVYGGFRFKI